MKIARIDHLAFWANDLDKVCAFYARYFGANIGALYTNPRKGFASRFLAFGDGARLEVMATSSLELARAAPGAHRHGLAHFAISVGSEQEVDALTQLMHEQGVSVLDGPRRTGDGYYEGIVLDPEGNRVEITV